MYCLLIDDDIPTIDVLKDMIDWSKFGVTRVKSAYNIYDAKALFEQSVPDVIICDIEMPQGTGLDMIEWVRKNNYDCAFIFFTCHESFEFASVAITYRADDYITKPFERGEIELSLHKAMESLHKRRQKDQYSRYGQSWLNNKTRIEYGFWHDILFKAIIPREDFIQAEIIKRDIDVAIEGKYRLALACVSKSELALKWDDTSFQYAFRSLCSEVIFGAVDHPRFISYQVGSNYYVVMILEGEHSDEEMNDKLETLIHHSKELLRCTVTCYWSDITTIASMEKTKADLERMDKENIIYRGNAHAFRSMSYQISQPYKLNISYINDLFMRRERVNIVNFMKDELQRLTAQDELDLYTMQTIHRDFMQVVYTLLYKNNIQAHQLFADEATQQLDKEAVSSAFNFMKWVTYVTNTAIDYLKEVADSEGTVDKIKRYIHEHYHQGLNRDKLAEVVYLTPDYLAKRFKSEVGLSIIEYLNEYRIKKAQEKLLQDDESISEIAMSTGFDSISYFSTVFKKMTGLSPSMYRAQHKTSS